MEKWKPSVSVTAETIQTDKDNHGVKASCGPQDKTADQSAVKDSSTSQNAVPDGKNVDQNTMENQDNAVKDQNNGRKKYSCDINAGTLPYPCAPMAFPYIPMQGNNPVRYSRMEALETGTLFPGLNLPFKAAIQARTKLSNTALVELMALDFAVQELGLYLTTHADDQEALQLYWSYLQLAKEGRERYERQYGPVLQSDPTPESGYIWLNDPWPWDMNET